MTRLVVSLGVIGVMAACGGSSRGNRGGGDDGGVSGPATDGSGLGLDARTTDASSTDAGAILDAGSGDASDAEWADSAVVGLGLEWIRIEAGSFTMGAEGRPDGTSQVTLTHPFEILATEVTQDVFERLTGYNHSTHTDCGDCPVERVSWHEAAEFANLLSDDAGLTRCYSCTGSGSSVTCRPPGDPYACTGYRLPTGAEFEYVARAGTDTDTYAGDFVGGDICNSVLDAIAWHCGNASDSTHPVAQLTANAWGVYDLLGNASEWCDDFWDGSAYPASLVDPSGPDEGSSNVTRGGSFSSAAGIERVAAWSRFAHTPASRLREVGFRTVRTLP